MSNTQSALLGFFKGEVENITSLGVIDESKVYTSEDYVNLVKVEEQARQNGIELGNHARVPQTDNQGMLLRTPRDRHVVMPDIAFANRIRANEDKTISMVIDYRAIDEQKNGMLYATSVVSYKIGKAKGKSEKYAVLAVENIPEQDFINQFTATLNEEDAKMMYEVITHHQDIGTNTGVSLDSYFK